MWNQARYGATDVISGSGALTIETVDSLRRLLETKVAQGQPRLVLDCRQIALIDSAGLELLLDIREACVRRGGQFPLAALTPLCRDILQVTGVSEHFEIYNDSIAAAGSFAQ